MPTLLACCVGAMLAAPPAPPEPQTQTETGILVNRINRVLVLMDADQKAMRSFEVPDDVPIMLDDMPAKLEQLQPGDTIELTLSSGRRVAAVHAQSGKMRALGGARPPAARCAAG